MLTYNVQFTSLQILMSVPLILTTVTQTLSVPTLLVVLPVPVTKASLGMDSCARVKLFICTYVHNLSETLLIQILMSVPRILIPVILTLSVPTPLVASPVPVTKASLEMVQAALV